MKTLLLAFFKLDCLCVHDFGEELMSQVSETWREACRLSQQGQGTGDTVTESGMGEAVEVLKQAVLSNAMDIKK